LHTLEIRGYHPCHTLDIRGFHITHSRNQSVLHSTQRATKGVLSNRSHVSVLIRRNPLCPYGIASCKAYGFSSSGVFKKCDCSRNGQNSHWRYRGGRIYEEPESTRTELVLGTDECRVHSFLLYTHAYAHTVCVHDVLAQGEVEEGADACTLLPCRDRRVPTLANARHYRDTSLARSSPPFQGRHRALGILLL